MLLFICCIVLAQAYVFQWMIPAYQKIAQGLTAVTPDLSKGYGYLLTLVVVLVVFSAAIILLVRNKIKQAKNVELTLSK